MPMVDNIYAAKAAPYTNAAVEITKALFGDKEKADQYKYSKAHTALVEAQTQNQLAEAAKRTAEANGTGDSKYAPIRIPGKSLTAMQTMAQKLLESQYPGIDYNSIPEEAKFNANSAGETAYSRSRNQGNGVKAMIDALSIPAGSTMKNIDTTPGTNWNPMNWGGGKDVIIDPSGQQFNFGGPQVGAMPELLDNLPRTQTPALPGTDPVQEFHDAQARQQAITGVSPAQNSTARMNVAQPGQRVYPSLQAAQSAPISEGGFTPMSPEQAASLPPGTKFLGMDGVFRTKR